MAKSRKAQLATGVIGGMIIVSLLVIVFKPVQIFGNFMSPNYKDKDKYIVNKFSYTMSTPKRGDVILYDHSQYKFTAITRIIGLPSEQVQISSGQVLINGEVLSEPYLPIGTTTLPTKTVDGDKNYYQNDEIVTLGSNEYFVLGDKRESSIDSRGFGPIQSSDITGKLLIKY